MRAGFWGVGDEYRRSTFSGVARLYGLEGLERLKEAHVAIVGGRNLGDEYFDAKPELNFTDIDLLSVGPVAGWSRVR